MFRKLSVRLSVILIVVFVSVTLVFSIYLARKISEEFGRIIQNKAIAAAQTGARIIGCAMDNIIDNSLFTVDQVFDHTLSEIELPPRILESYGDLAPDTLKKYRKYHYSTTLDLYLENELLLFQDAFLEDSQTIYAAVTDINGYNPVHNSKFNRPLSGNFSLDRDSSRIKRIYDDPVGIKAARNFEEPYLKQVYHRDTGELMWDISAPIFVKGRHWGTFRIGISMEETRQAVSKIRTGMFFLMGLLMLVLALIINRVSAWTMRPLNRLHEGVEHVSRGDLSYKQEVTANDEVGDLARAFNKMTCDLQKHIDELQETTAAKERIESELKIAHDIQVSMLPRTFPAFPDRQEINLYAILEPAKEVGGDFYDFFFVDDNHLCFCIGDVSGKGVPASLFMAVTRTLIKTKTTKGLSTDTVLTRVNEDLYLDNDTCMFVTLFCAILDLRNGELEYANAGHNPPLICKKGGEFSYLELAKETALGILEDIKYTSERLKLAPGDKIFLYTDGITEAMDPEYLQFSPGRLKEVLDKERTSGEETLIKSVVLRVREFIREAPQSDDITALVLEYKGSD